jgi:hypothetical protein
MTLGAYPSFQGEWSPLFAHPSTFDLLGEYVFGRNLNYGKWSAETT